MLADVASDDGSALENVSMVRARFHRAPGRLAASLLPFRLSHSFSYRRPPMG
jgi:hypothetical protein